MRRIIILAVVLVACSGSASAATNTDTGNYWPGFINGNEWRDWPTNVRLSYVFGAVDGFLYSGTFGAHENITNFIQICLDGKQGEQMLASVDKYMRDHPENWDKGMNFNVWWAIYDVCIES